jgi:protein-S-isoprenylcysteine O-methyltransferase Ste14
MDEIIYIFSFICSISGAGFFVISLYLITKIKGLFPGSNINKKWIIIQMLIILFLFGYVFNIIFLALDMPDIIAIMTAIVYIFGALFVLIVINLSYKTYRTILLEPVSKKEK